MNAGMLDWKVRFPFMNFNHHFWRNKMDNKTRDKWLPIRSSRICSSEHFDDDNCHKIWYRTSKETNVKKDTVPTVYHSNATPITSATVSAPVRSVVWKIEAHQVYPGTDANIWAIHWCDETKTVQLWHHDCRLNLQDGNSTYS